MRTFPEPQLLSDILQQLNTRMMSNNLSHTISFLADAPVFLYPLMLITLYIIGIIGHQKTKHGTTEKNIDQTGDTQPQIIYKKGALYLFTSAISIFILNYIIKIFFQRPRPYKELNLTIPTEELALSNIPTDSFPSDHAAMSATIAMSLYLWGKHSQKKVFIYLSYFFVCIALMMGIGRITIAIHRPTDIIVGYGVGILVSFLLLQKPLIGLCNKVWNVCINSEKFITSKIFKTKK